jgi:hypothetical protein
VESTQTISREEFRCKLKEEWKLMWTERYDDRVKAEGVVVRDYPLLFMDRGFVIFASRDAKTPAFREIVEFWASKGLVYSPDPTVGGWGKFIRAELKNAVHSRAKAFANSQPSCKKAKQHLKKGGRGWLHA